jgi:hypothetical protein
MKKTSSKTAFGSNLIAAMKSVAAHLRGQIQLDTNPPQAAPLDTSEE